MRTAIVGGNVISRMGTYRAILTDREREILTGEADVSREYVYQIRTRVRNKIDRLAADVEILEEYQPDLYEELQDALDSVA
jgi:hypothetical protein